MKSGAGASGLALVRLEAWQKAGTLDAGAAKVKPAQPAWMKLVDNG